MQLEKSRSIASRVKTVSAAVASALVVAHASAAGLGKLTVLSAIGQPLRAEIELTAVSAEEARGLQPKLASLDAFRLANIEFNPTLQSLRFAIEQRGTRQIIRITTTQPINEPFVDVLLELNGGNGRLLREYTFLLDPPELRSVQPAQTAQPATVTTTTPTTPTNPATPVTPAPNAPQATVITTTSTPVPAAQPVRPEPRPEAVARSAPTAKPVMAVKPGVVARSSQPASAKPPVAASAPNGNSPGTEYQVKRGDSLSKIANRTRSNGISLDQMLVSLYRTNPDAFVGNNMNRLRAGQILSLPTAETTAAVSPTEAQDIVIAQAGDFNDYRSKLAGRVAAGPARAASESRQSDSGKIAAKVEEKPNAANEAVDKLKLSKADATGSAKSQAIQEERVAREKAAADSAGRVKDLEKNIGDLQKLLDVKSKDLGEKQKAADAANAAAKASTPPVAAAAVPAPVPAAVVAPVAVIAAAKPLPAAPVAAPAVAPAAGVAPVPVAATGSSPVVEKPVEPPPPPVQAVKPRVAKTAAEPGIFDDLLTNPLAQAGAILLALILAGVAFMRSRGNKPAPAFPDTSAPDSSLKANSIFGSTGGQSVDTNNSVFNSSFAPAASNLDTNEVDPVAEADVYIAYGRDAQAEEILKEALRTQPERHAVRVKLLEIYASRKDVRAFESVATELYSMTKGEGDEWAQAAPMGLALDPGNALYATSQNSLQGVTRAAALPADSAELDAFLGELTAANPHGVAAVAAVPAPASVVPHGGLPASDLLVPVAGLAVVAAAATADTAAMPVHPAPATPPHLADDNSLDFDLDGLHFDTDKPAADLPHQAAGNAALPAANDAQSPLSAHDFEFLSKDAVTVPVAGPTLHVPQVPVVALAPVAFEPFNLAPAAQVAHTEPAPDEHAAKAITPVRPDPLEFDLSGITLELPDHAVPEAPMAFDNGAPRSAGAPALQEDFTALDLTAVAEHDDAAGIGSLGNNAEMATKLDLAVAYQEIGDQDGARELLDEVVKGGNAEQSEKARSILKRLG